MLVIQGSFSSTTGSFTANTTYTFPAEDCVWEQADSSDGTGYTISEAFYIKKTYDDEISNPRLGYIGKSGRFVPISDAS